MSISPRRLKFLLNVFPAMFFSGIRVRGFSKDFREVRVVVRKSLLNKNFESSIFGGSLFSSADPFFNLLYWQSLDDRGIRVQSFLKSAQIEYLKPVEKRIEWRFCISQEDLDLAERTLRTEGKFERVHRITAKNERGEDCVKFSATVHLRALD